MRGFFAMFAILVLGALTVRGFAQLTLSCDQVRSIHRQYGHEEFLRMAKQLGLTEAQMRSAMACIERRR